ncbi:MAG: AMP-binding protein [Candidatus Hydrogenedens sp.]|nr:AMP-binding protein [Candidatus Hydrogenedens sp.]
MQDSINSINQVQTTGLTPFGPGGERPKTRAEQAIPYGSIVDMLHQRAETQGDKCARTWLLDGESQERHVTYAELDAQARAVAVELLKITGPGERALLLYAPGTEYIAAFLGCLYAGVIAVPAYPPDPARLKVTLPRVKNIVRDSDAAVALTTSDVLPLVGKLFEGDNSVRPVKWLATDSVSPSQADAWIDPKPGWGDLAFLQYTSGSTSDPKGVMVTHGNLLHNLGTTSQAAERMGARIETYVSWLPVYHDMGLIGGLLQPIYDGGRGISMSPMAFLQRPLRWLQAITKYRGTTSSFPNFALELCVRKVTEEQRDALDLSSWTMACNGAEPLRANVAEEFIAYFAPAGFRAQAHSPGYGMAENTLAVTLDDFGAPHKVLEISAKSLEEHRALPAEPGEVSRRIVGCGTPLEDTDLLIVDPETRVTLGEDEVGEIWIGSPANALGYWNNPELSERTFRGITSDSNRGPYLRSGDLGFMHEGNLYVTGRLKDMIIVDGANHYPQDIEVTVEGAHPLVRSGCVAAFSIDDGGKERLVVVAEVTTTEGTNGAEIVAAVRAAVSANHSLRAHDVVLIQPRSIYKTSSGKLQRHACRNGYLGNTLDLIGE